MTDLFCPTGAQANCCPASTDEALPAVTGLLPQGPVWDAGLVPGTYQNQFWRAFANMAQFFYAMFCAYLLEFYCSTADQSLDQWGEEFDINNPCDAYGGSLCAKMTAIGGQDASYFVQTAADAGYSITVQDLAVSPRPIAGCFQVGCVGLGPTPKRVRVVYDDGIKCVLDGQVTDHPAKHLWEASKAHLSVECPVPGSNLGLGSGTIDTECCFIVGYYDPALTVTTATAPLGTDACNTLGELIYIGCNNQVLPAQRYEPSDSTGHWQIGFGDIFTWVVTVHEGPNFNKGTPLSNAGNFVVGCTPLCPPTEPDTLCFLDQIKPAHTTLVVRHAA